MKSAVNLEFTLKNVNLISSTQSFVVPGMVLSVSCDSFGFLLGDRCFLAASALFVLKSVWLLN